MAQHDVEVALRGNHQSIGPGTNSSIGRMTAHNTLNIGTIVEEDLEEDAITANVDNLGHINDSGLLVFLSVQFQSEHHQLDLRTNPQVNRNGTSRIIWTESLQSGELLPIARRIGPSQRKRSQGNGEEDELFMDEEEGMEQRNADEDVQHRLADTAPLLAAPRFLDFQPDGTTVVIPSSTLMDKIRTTQRWVYLLGDFVALVFTLLPVILRILVKTPKKEGDTKEGKFLRGFVPIVVTYRRAVFLCLAVTLVCSLDDFLTVRQRRRAGYLPNGSGDGGHSSAAGTAFGGRGGGAPDSSESSGGGGSDGNSNSNSDPRDFGTKMKHFLARVRQRFTVRGGVFEAGAEFGQLALTFILVVLHFGAFGISLVLEQPQVIMSKYDGVKYENDKGVMVHTDWEKVALDDRKFKQIYDLYHLLNYARFGLVFLSLVLASIFAWYESTNAIIETGRSWRSRFHQLLDGGRSYRLPPTHIRAIAHLLRDGLDRANASLVLYNEPPVLSAEDEKMAIASAAAAATPAAASSGSESMVVGTAARNEASVIHDTLSPRTQTPPE